MCDEYDGDGPDFSSEKWVRARKSHQCETVNCDINIRPGDVYHRDAVGWEGTITVMKHCARCWSICEALWRAGAQSIDMRLDCGERWRDNWSAEEPAHLAFMTADEAQQLVPAVKT